MRKAKSKRNVLRTRRKVMPAYAPPMGRGGQRHRYLQHLIECLAEARGYRAVSEKQILGGSGRVDVSLKNAEKKIASEVSVSSNSEQERENIQSA